MEEVSPGKLRDADFVSLSCIAGRACCVVGPAAMRHDSTFHKNLRNIIVRPVMDSASTESSEISTFHHGSRRWRLYSGIRCPAIETAFPY